jgi:hypothetical protein
MSEDARGPGSAGDKDAISRLGAALGSLAPGRKPPVERWNPPYCGEIDMAIAEDGTWSYNGSPIRRQALVRLFASVLRRDPDRFVLVTPVERVGIRVADVPFLAVEMAVDSSGDRRSLAFRTNVDDLVRVDADHPLRFAAEAGGGIRPYVLVRGGLWARLTRPLAYDLLDLAEERVIDGAPVFGVAVEGQFYLLPAAEPA